ncbi:hypothetical protein ASD64_08895 [Mesorhizobium sp. Root157]|uniref:hypothetical protein n=1 Tax=Mesorhizobium sp. Root157 TaxID=1736477 RepID=UPI0006F57C49|nr:hypothetical protein [Mesorhizobium sp. Root157]KQZ81866.1 hypothetical protein ASD64_08895 [Mesorhizobium sp. Root157]
MLALIHNDTIVSQTVPGGWFNLPNGDRASPAHDGWSDGEYSLATIQPADVVPEGKQVLSTTVEMVDGLPKYVHVLDDIPSPTVGDFQRAIQAHVDTVAVAKLYNDGNALAGYVNSTVPQWAAEAQAFVAWRDAVWVYAYTELDKVQSGQRPAPTIEAFIAELPDIEWPS